VRPATIETDRLRLLPLRPDVAAAVVNDRERAERMLQLRFEDDWPAADLREALLTITSEGPFGPYLIVERATNTVVGDVGYLGPPDAAGEVELGYSVVLSRRRRGYATEAASALVTWALEQRDVTAVTAECEATNTASIRTLERLEFERQGQRERVIRWRRDRGSRPG
jgi:ribosomal-protein-alanine N-acetyltransferase